MLGEDLLLKPVTLFLFRRSSESTELLAKRRLELLNLRYVGQEAADVGLFERLTLMRVNSLHET